MAPIDPRTGLPADADTLADWRWSDSKADHPDYTPPTGCPSEYPDTCPTPLTCPVHEPQEG